MEEGDVFAIETFGTTGRGYMRDDVGVYGYGRNENVGSAGLHHASAKSLLKSIDDNFGTLVFARRYLERIGVKNYHLGMRSLVSNGIMGEYIARIFDEVKGRPLYVVEKVWGGEVEAREAVPERRVATAAPPLVIARASSGGGGSAAASAATTAKSGLPRT